jgi:hypothetical protein
MNLDAVNRAANQRLPWSRWENQPFSQISHHKAACCEAAREWLLARDFAETNGASPMTGPRWLRNVYEWGASGWTIFWCQAVKQKILDCGALSDMAIQIFRRRGIAAFPVQLVQQFTTQAVRHWAAAWREREISANWLDFDTIYHEVCAVSNNGSQIKIWDASSAYWLNPNQKCGGYNSVLAIRIFADPQRTFRWGDNVLKTNCWQKIQETF